MSAGWQELWWRYWWKSVTTSVTTNWFLFNLIVTSRFFFHIYISFFSYFLSCSFSYLYIIYIIYIYIYVMYIIYLIYIYNIYIYIYIYNYFLSSLFKLSLTSGSVCSTASLSNVSDNLNKWISTGKNHVTYCNCTIDCDSWKLFPTVQRFPWQWLF